MFSRDLLSNQTSTMSPFVVEFITSNWIEKGHGSRVSITLLKVQASELAVETVMHAMRTAGLSGYRNDGEFDEIFCSHPRETAPNQGDGVLIYLDEGQGQAIDQFDRVSRCEVWVLTPQQVKSLYPQLILGLV